MPRNPHQMPEIEKGHTITPTRAMKERGEAMASPFEHYCRERWQFNASRARQLIGSVGVIENLKSVTQVTPTTEKNISPIGENEEIPESQLRPLTKLEPEQQKEARHSILCLLSRWQGRIKKSETGKSGGSHRLLTTTLIGGKRMAINHVTFFLSGINHKASNALTSSACSSLQ